MDEFRRFLKKGGRSERAAERAIAHVAEFAGYLAEHGKGLDGADGADLESFVARVEGEPRASAKTHLWAIRYYCEHTANEGLRRLAGVLREQRMERKPFPLSGFCGVDPADVERLAAAGVRNIEQLLEAGRTGEGRAALAEETGVPADAVLKLVQLSDLARIPGVKGVRARLYYDAGVDTVQKMAEWEPEPLREMVAAFVERTAFDGVAPLPAEARYTVDWARRLPAVVEYE